MSINEEIAKAFGAHGAWKTRIAQAVDNGYSEHEPEDVAADDRCAFGRWLADPSLPSSVRASEDYQTVSRLHADFHKAAGATLAKAVAGDRHGANADLHDGAFARAAEALSAALIRWQRIDATGRSGDRGRSWRAACLFWKGRVALRIWAAIAIPSLTAVVTGVLFNVQLMQTAIGTERMEQATTLLIGITATVHEAQKERGLSVAAATGTDPRIMARRKAQIEATDRQRRAMESHARAILAAMPPDVARQWRAATSGLDSIDMLRTRLDTGGMKPADIAAGYTEQINKLISFEAAAATLAVRPDVARDMTEVLRLSRAKEAAGQERAVGAAAIVTGGVTMAARHRLMELATEQTVRFHAFLSEATPRQRDMLAQALAAPASTAFDKFRAALAEGDVSGLSATAWFNVATARIDRLHATEDGILAEIQQAAHAHNIEAWREMELFIFLVGAASLGGGALVFLLARGITLPVLRLTEAMHHIAAGQVRIPVPGTGNPDEIGEMARAVLVFQQQALTVEQMTEDAEIQRRKSEEARRQALATMAETIEGKTGEVVKRVAEESGRVNDTADRMAKSAIRVEENASRVAAAAGQSLSNAQAVAGASEQLSASIREIAAQVERSKDMVGDAVQAAGAAADTVNHLAEAMTAIDEVVHVITDIASQTNLLALNATIEAARAGEAGKGFAVVAHEVKTLASQTAKQTGDIAARITTLKEMAGRVTGAIDGVVGHIHGVEKIAEGIAAAVEEQDAATREISRNVQQSAQSAQDVTERIVTVAEEASTTGKQAEEVETMLDAMAEQVAELSHALTKVVRTATPDVNRRASPRFAIKARIGLVGAHGETEGDLADISLSGAHVVGLSGLQAGQRCRLTVDGITVQVTVLECEKGLCRLKMDGKPDDALARWIEEKSGVPALAA